MARYRIEILKSGNADTINLEGCQGIEKYTSDLISISLTERTLHIKGENLSMPVLAGGKLCINGHIENLNFTCKEKK
jgi:sporulation protein YqfC